MSHSPSQRGDAPVLYDKGENPPQKILARIKEEGRKGASFPSPQCRSKVKNTDYSTAV